MNKQQQAFIEKLDKNPDDNDVRLIYADWLEINDEPEEAKRMRQWKAAKEWLTKLAEELGGDGYDETPFTFEMLIKIGNDWLLEGEYYEWGGEKSWEGEVFVQHGSQQAQHVLYEKKVQFWENWQIITGIHVPEDKKGIPFSCSC